MEAYRALKNTNETYQNMPALAPEAAMIGTSDKKALWLMSRQLTLEPIALQKMREQLNKCGSLTWIETLGLRETQNHAK